MPEGVRTPCTPPVNPPLIIYIYDDSPGFHLKDGLTINDLDFADDITTIAKSLREHHSLSANC